MSSREIPTLSQRIARRRWLSIVTRGLMAQGACRSALALRSLARLSGPTVAAMTVGAVASQTGCRTASTITRQPDLIWGRKGLSEGRFLKPRALAIDRNDQIFVVDMTGRIQVFDRDGKYIRGWQTPEKVQGKPTGLGMGIDGSLLVADTHYHRVLAYTPLGELQTERIIGGQFGNEPSQFHFVTDVMQSPSGHIFAGQYGELDQIQEFDASGKFVRRWGKHSNDLDGFDRPQSLVLDKQGRLWIADSSNHRLLVFELEPAEPKLVKVIGTHGQDKGQFVFPYGLAFDRDDNLLVVELGNHRVQRLATDGTCLESWGEPGTAPGQFSSPWSLAVDSRGAIHVLDSWNHRVQRFSS